MFDELSKDMSESHLDDLEEALGTKIKDREAFLDAFKGLVTCFSKPSSDEDEEDEEEEEEAPKAKKGIDIALILGGKPKKKDA